MPCLRLKIVKENHTLFTGTNKLTGPNKFRQCPASGIYMWTTIYKESDAVIWNFHILDESGKIDSTVNLAFRVTFHVSLLLTKWTVAIDVNVMQYIGV